jgi:hypothetical protein
VRACLLGLVAVAIAGTAWAQPAPGSASAKTQLQSLHYNNIRDLRRGPNGQWTGKATQNGVQKQVTISPKGIVTAR